MEFVRPRRSRRRGGLHTPGVVIVVVVVVVVIVVVVIIIVIVVETGLAWFLLVLAASNAADSLDGDGTCASSSGDSISVNARSLRLVPHTHSPAFACQTIYGLCNAFCIKK